jgi:tRNA(Ile)-lysidine synthase
MLSQFLTFVHQQPIGLTPQSSVLLTVSGGVDSMVMLDLFARSGLTFGIAHCNFGLRGAESDGDQQLVENLALSNTIPIFTERFETKQYAQSQGISTQMAARDLRYAWFEKIRTEHNYDFIATAHHQDDNLETILLNLTRGTGLAGLHGIAARNNYVVRPMLFANREKIEEYAHLNNIAWREDSSNQSTDYKRNKLRKTVLPILKELNPKVESAVYEMSLRVAAAERMLSYQLSVISYQRAANRLSGGEPLVSYRIGNSVAGQLSDIKHQTSNIQTINIKQLETVIEPVEFLDYLLKNNGFSYGQCVAIWTNRDCETGKQYLSATHTLTKDRDCFVLTSRLSDDFENVLIERFGRNVGKVLNVRRPVLSNVKDKSQLVFEYTESITDLNTGRNTVVVNADALVFPLTLRRWRAGDWFCPLGMGGKRKKISDFLIDLKTPRSNKTEVLVIESDSKIVWVVGLRLDERFRINENTLNYLRINLKTN